MTKSQTEGKKEYYWSIEISCNLFKVYKINQDNKYSNINLLKRRKLLFGDKQSALNVLNKIKKIL